jgi:hypothetical protein
MAIGPISKFSSAVDKVFKEFIEDFKRSIKPFQKS